MKKIAAVSTLALVLGAGSAMGADVYDGASYKDTGSVSPAARSGFLVTGIIGYSWTDRKISHSVNREAGIFVDKPTEAQFAGEDGELSEEEKAAYDDAVEEFDAGVKAIQAEIPGAHTDATSLFIPVVSDALSVAGNEDVGNFIFGGELSYLWRTSQRFALESVIGLDIHSDNKTTLAHTNVQGVSTGLFELPTHPALGQSGLASIDRSMDLHLKLRAHLYTSNNFSAFVGGGVSIAFAEVCGKNSSDAQVGNAELQSAINTAFNTSHCNDDVSVGPVVEVGFTYWPRENIRIMGLASWESNEFNSDGSSQLKVPFRDNAPVGIYGASTGRVEAEDDTVKVKVGASYFFID